MKITHQLGSVVRSGEGDGTFLLTNKKGNFLALGSPNTSSFHGLFHYSALGVVKVLESITPQGVEHEEIINHFSHIERRSRRTNHTNQTGNTGNTEETEEADEASKNGSMSSGMIIERFFLSSNGFLYEIEGYDGDLLVTFDMKKLYDDRSDGRIYTCEVDEEEEGCGAAVRYKKLEHDGSTQVNYELFAMLAASPIENEHESENEHGGGESNAKGVHTKHAKHVTCSVVDKWREVELPYDKLRGMEASRWVYDALSFRVSGPTRILMTFSHTDEKADKKLTYVWEHQEEVLAAIERYPRNRLAAARQDVPLAAAINALDALVTKLKQSPRMDRPSIDGGGEGTKGSMKEGMKEGTKEDTKNALQPRGIFAGLPWFFQFWGRDELICLRALMLQKQYALVKEVLLRWIDSYAEGPMNALGSEGVESVDAPGLLCLRLTQFLVTLKHEKLRDQFFKKEELKKIKGQVEAIVRRLRELRDLHGFIQNTVLGTWMDTVSTKDSRGREGIRVEIQTFMIAAYRCMALLCELVREDPHEWVAAAAELKAITREWFYDRRGMMHDGFIDGGADPRVRPNLFLAWYAVPDLLSREEWRRCFDHALAELWLDWGGLASIGKKDPLFCASHTGVNNESYHRGDSWFFVNNLAAIALFSVDPHAYADKIEAILQASEKDLLFRGFAGHASEVSDAAAMNPRGCWAQAWSAATLIELIWELRGE